MLSDELITKVNMVIEKVTLTWHSYTSHFQEFWGNLFDTGDSSDVTLVCDDQVKFKAHKFVWKVCSSVFESILDETNESKSIVYLRGVNQLELKPILNFIYFGPASLYQERMKDFIKIGKELQIKGIEEVPEEDEMRDVGENMAKKPVPYVKSEKVFRDVNDRENENKIACYTTRNESIPQISVPSDSSQCPECNAVFTYRQAMLRHVRTKHEGVKYPCSQCDYTFTQQSNLKQHIESVHEGLKYPCNQCDFKASKPCILKRHMKLKHDFNFIVSISPGELFKD